ncbi:helix-turn-helix domain-containing protein [Brevibacterium luteolum]|uniref:helix-turn-helix domain-containing protein n=1 Tax=Brevibacterium luteolum TaxID=199591 RepID=UPI00223AD822|nr:helix-turn-helix domain-containing protein [Brevibacterium luteolum]MCT1656961.1 helix-turn-helix domain-containing protein [Brevibacterium luteolum]
MAGATKHERSSELRDVVDEALDTMPNLTDNVRAAFGRLIDVLESSGDAVVFPAEASLSTTQAADLLGVSRMTVVRLIDRGELHAGTSSVHRRIPVSELKRYQTEFRRRQRTAMSELAEDITATTPADRVIETR